mmetsp:Transcript_7485/g.23800  ORF Transcript_7485/g.23800 Transcript_7485/m.23800 type:complete len:233 (+) Transcript_7485:305-1003(+)
MPRARVRQAYVERPARGLLWQGVQECGSRGCEHGGRSSVRGRGGGRRYSDGRGGALLDARLWEADLEWDAEPVLQPKVQGHRGGRRHLPAGSPHRRCYGPLCSARLLGRLRQTHLEPQAQRVLQQGLQGRGASLHTGSAGGACAFRRGHTGSRGAGGVGGADLHGTRLRQADLERPAERVLREGLQGGAQAEAGLRRPCRPGQVPGAGAAVPEQVEGRREPSEDQEHLVRPG